VTGLIASGNRVTGVHMIDAQTRAQRVYSARVIFLCASALESARILLNSGIGNSSGQVGRNVMDHIKWGGASGVFDGWTDRRTIGERPNASTCRAFAMSHRAIPTSSAATDFRAARVARGGTPRFTHPASGRRSRRGSPSSALVDELRWIRRDAAA